jgi:NAD(P) transhydrogenase subunit beta
MELKILLDIGYFIGAVLFIFGLRQLSSPDTARKGNLLAGLGMAFAIVCTLFYPLETGSNNYLWILGGLLVGGTVGWIMAKKVAMTDMPQLVSLFNGFGGACAVVLGGTEFRNAIVHETALSNTGLFILLITIFIGGIAFTGSLLAYGKLQGLVNDKKVTFNGHTYLNLILLVAIIALLVFLIATGAVDQIWVWVIFVAIILIYGFSFVAPIGGADMPVVISLLNSFSGLSAAAAGLLYNNQIMLIGGILVGASGTILTLMMCKAMNRSLMNVIIGGFGSSNTSAAKGAVGDQVAIEVSINDAAIQLYYAKSVVFVPGYGLAVAQAQKTCKELDDLLEANGVEVSYAIHPVAGRMPGHMNVLLAEADVPYPKLLDLDDANAKIKEADVSIIVGANDVVNPAALDDPSSPIYGMPVLEVWKSKNVFVMKRSMNPGYAGIQNPLFFLDNTRMLFGDAKDTLKKLVTEVKSL